MGCSYAIRPRLLIPAALAAGVAAWNSNHLEPQLGWGDEVALIIGFLSFKVTFFSVLLHVTVLFQTLPMPSYGRFTSMQDAASSFNHPLPLAGPLLSRGFATPQLLVKEGGRWAA